MGAGGGRAAGCATAGEPALQAEVLANLAELRVAQVRLEDAERLLADLDDRLESARAIAELRLVRGACDLAALMLTRRLREVTEDCSERGALLERLVEAELGRSARTRQMQVAHQLADLAARLRCDMGPDTLPRHRGLP